MTPINFRLMFQSLKLRPWMGRSLQASALILVLIAASVTPALAQTQTLTWQNALAQLFARQKKKGVSRGPSFCAVTPTSYKAMPRSGGTRVFSSPSQRLLSEKPLIAWYGNVSSIKIRNLTTGTEPIPISSKFEVKETVKETEASSLLRGPILNQMQYGGAALLPGQDYEMMFMAPNRPDEKIEFYRFRTVSQADRDRLNEQLKDLAAQATKTKADPILIQVEFLLQQNLVNDAHMLILQQSNPSPELAAAIAVVESPCEEKLKIKAPPTLDKPTPAAPR
jgi:hypothetical protein